MVAEIVSPPLFPTLVKPSSRAIDLSVRCQVFHRFSLGGFHLVVIAQTTTKCRKDPGDLLNRMLLFYLWMECKTDVESYSWIVFTVPDFIGTSIDLLKLLFLLFFFLFCLSSFLYCVVFFFFFSLYCNIISICIAWIYSFKYINWDQLRETWFFKIVFIILLFEMLLQYKFCILKYYSLYFFWIFICVLCWKLI